jgi:hypothetical protein
MSKRLHWAICRAVYPLRIPSDVAPPLNCCNVHNVHDVHYVHYVHDRHRCPRLSAFLPGIVAQVPMPCGAIPLP